MENKKTNFISRIRKDNMYSFILLILIAYFSYRVINYEIVLLNLEKKSTPDLCFITLINYLLIGLFVCILASVIKKEEINKWYNPGLADGLFAGLIIGFIIFIILKLISGELILGLICGSIIGLVLGIGIGLFNEFKN